MRQSTIYHQQSERPRLSFAVCRKCGKQVAVYTLPDQDAGLVLLENGFEKTRGMDEELTMECKSCWEIRPDVINGFFGPRCWHSIIKLNQEWRGLVNGNRTDHGANA
jgi:hypothetical protein